ncbi:4-amino-4-deoxy-L-arabinose transferase-like glycosyltransferase [Nocardia sp. GAS34]|uniref:ArnT family glycosyltransferase n=1 Tax=unclassified Nocardia TaxID=2637762 RepID=UPI003D260802
MVSISAEGADVVQEQPVRPPAEATADAADRPRWVRPSLAALLVTTAVLYLWGLRSAGWANNFYAAAVQSGTKSWKALLFASLDPGNSITVDKPPANMWLMALSGRAFGFSAWSMLLPQALLGVATVALLYGAVRRTSGYGAGLLAGAAMAATPVAALMFRYDNPDALMMFLIVAAAYYVVRALQAPRAGWRSAGTGWLALAGVAIGFGFLTKMGQALLVLPGLALVVLVAMPGGFWSRIGKLLTAGVAVVVSAGWFVALVALWPAGSRPFIGGSTTNSLWELAVGYNGLGRLLGNKHGGGAKAPAHPAASTAHAVATHAVPHGGGFGGMVGGSNGLSRLFQPSLATEYSWLLPVAVVGLLAGLWLTRRAARTDADRAGLILWGGWLLGTGLVLSYMSSGFHTYYTIELTPAIAALGAIGATLLWRRRSHWGARLTLAAMSVATGAWVFHLLGLTPNWLPWLRWTLLIGAVVAAVVLVAFGAAGTSAAAEGRGRAGRAGVAIAAAALIFGLAAPAAYAVETVALPHSGGSPYSGPARGSGEHGWGDESTTATTQLDAMLGAASGSRWAAAAIGSQQVSSIELRTGASLMAIGGFSGRDPWPTLAQFQQYVANGDVHYFLLSSRSQGHGAAPATDTHGSATGTHTGTHAPGTHANGQTPNPASEQNTQPGANFGGWQGFGSSANTTGGQITAWVQAHYTPTTVDGVQVYDLTTPPKA